MKEKLMRTLTVVAAVLIVGAVAFIVLSLLGAAIGVLLAIIPIVLVVVAVLAIVSAVKGEPIEVEWSFGNGSDDTTDENDDVISVEDYKELDE